MKRSIFALAAMFAAVAQADTSISPITDLGWRSFRGGQIVSTHRTEAECWSFMRATVDARRLSESNVDCRNYKRAAITYIDVTPSACTTPQPPAESQTVACPSGTTGTWQQTRTYAAAPAPTCWAAGAWSPTAAPAGACVTPPPPTGAVLYFSDCQTGAAAGCVPGNNANPGTQAAPKRDLSGVNLNTLPAGATVLFKRGGAWNVSGVRLDNRNVTSSAPLTLADYGTGALPILNTPSGTAFEFGMYGNTVIDGGYTFRNLKIDGRGTGQWGAFVQGSLRDVVFDGVEITGFDIGIHAQQGAATRTAGLTIRNSTLRGNREHGFLGDADGLVIEGSLIEGNNPSGGGFEHGVYIGGRSSSFTVRNNVFRRNSVNSATGRCDGGNLTIHGAHQSVLIEGNLIEQNAADGGCYGISLTASYSTAEFFRNAVVRNNTIVNVGNCAMCISAAPGVMVEGNKIYNTQAAFHIGVIIPGSDPGTEDAQDGGAVIRNNLICHTAPTSGSSAVRAPSAASVTGNTYRTGADATTGACAR